MELRPYQHEALDAIYAAQARGVNRMIVSLPTGCHRAGQQVIMADGSLRAVEDVAVGEELLGLEGSRQVLALCRGEGKMFEVRPTAGEPWVINEEHILTLVSRSPGRPLVDMPLRTYLALPWMQRDAYRLVRVTRSNERVFWWKKDTFTIRNLETIEPYYGFVLSGDQRYMLADGTVTHNSGKTVIFSHLVADHRPRGRIIILCHRDELLTQTRDKICTIDPAAQSRIGLVKAKSNDVDAPIVLASVQTLAHQKRLHQLAQEWALIIADEVHHVSPGNSWTCSLEWLGAMNGTLTVGFTATPFRPNGTALIGEGSLFQEIVYYKHLLEMIEQGYLVMPQALRLTLKNFSLKGIKRSGDDYSASDLEDRMMKIEAPKHLAEALKVHAAGRRTISFAPGVALADELTSECVLRGIRATTIIGNTPRDERHEAYEQMRKGQLDVLSSVMVLSEGFDLPEVDAVLLARATRSKVLYQQAIGRGLRLSPATGKTDCIAEGQLVLTEKGLVPIEKVPYDVKVWDGMNWVTHGGPVYRGEREVITYGGLTATEDHKVWTTSAWLPFGTCASQQIPIVQTGFGRHAIRAFENHFPRSALDGKATFKEKEVCAKKTASPGHLHNLWQPFLEELRKYAQGNDGRVPCLCATAPSAEMALRQNDERTTTLYKSARSPLQGLRRAWYMFQLFFCDQCLSVGDGTFRDRPNTTNRPDRQQRALRSREFALVNSAAKFGTYTEDAEDASSSSFPCYISRDSLCRQHLDSVSQQGYVLRGHCNQMASPLNKTKGRVWDLLNAGPLHRFTVSNILVHNCLVIDSTGATSYNNLYSMAEMLGLVQPEESNSEKDTDILVEEEEEEESGDDTEHLEMLLEAHRRHLLRSSFNWVHTQKGAFVLALPERRTLRIKPTTVNRGTLEFKRDKLWETLATDIPITYAFGIGEDTARGLGYQQFLSKNALWLRRPATERQRQFAARLGIDHNAYATSGAINEAITKITGDW